MVLLRQVGLAPLNTLFLGALRSTAQMVSVAEVSLGFIIIVIILCVGSFNLNVIIESQNMYGLLYLFFLYF